MSALNEETFKENLAIHASKRILINMEEANVFLTGLEADVDFVNGNL